MRLYHVTQMNTVNIDCRDFFAQRIFVEAGFFEIYNILSLKHATLFFGNLVV